jgi:alpha-L-fucosidase 2
MQETNQCVISCSSFKCLELPYLYNYILMKYKLTLFLFLILLLLGGKTIMGQEATPLVPASMRSDKITANWTDRAQVANGGEKPQGHYLLWYQAPAKVWEEALPLGNGSLGAMVFGGVADERIQLNESTLWDGYALDPSNPESLKALPEVQKLLFEGKNNEAVQLAGKTMMGRPSGVKPYQSLGELWFDTPVLNASDYTRSLDLSTAIATTQYAADGVRYMREAFISPVDGLLIVHFTASKKRQINFSLTLKRQQDATCQASSTDPDALVLSGRLPVKDKEGIPRGLSFAVSAKAVAKGGKVTIENGIMKVSRANEVTLFIAGATNYPGLKNLSADINSLRIDPVKKCSDLIGKASSKKFSQLKLAHVAEHQRLFNRVDINLGQVDPKVLSLPTNQRLDMAKISGNADLGLVETFFQYGRYLLICSSRPGGMPANLQGLWAWQMNPPWNADFHTNINIQMNYWPAEITNLSEMYLPLFDLSDALVKPGEQTAKVQYGTGGWVVHHLTDAWGFTAPADGPQGIWPMGAAWLAQHPWEHFTYTGDKEFLKERAFPLMKGAARFIMDFLVEAPAGTACAGKLVTNPSYSPENEFYLPNGQKSVFTYGATMDLEIIHDLLTHCIEACDILNSDAAFRTECQKTLDRLAPIRISPTTGRILEWAEDYKETDPHHRHTSHLFGLYPGNQITTLGTPELAEAARKTLQARGDGGTGWGLAWKINMWNRLQDGDHAYKLLSVLLSTKTLPNLFDNHPPFQIDGNFGATAAIAEMLVQSQSRRQDGTYEIQLLPSLPSAMPEGSVKGLCARGGFVVDMAWKEGKVTEVTILSRNGGKLCLKSGSREFESPTTPGEIVQLDRNLNKKIRP